MKALRKFKISLTLLVLAFGIAQAQELSIPSKATSIPISSKAFRIRVLLPNGKPVSMTLHEGEMGKIVSKADGRCLGFAPIVSSSDPNQIEIRTCIISTRPDGNQTVKYSEKINTRINNISILNENSRSFEFEVLSITEGSDAPAAKGVGDINPMMIRGGGGCCVTCDGWTVCACAVEMSCGSCCSDPCC